MIVITNRKRVGQIRGQDIYRITSFEIVPFVKDLSSLTPAQVRHMECKKEQRDTWNLTFRLLLSGR